MATQTAVIIDHDVDSADLIADTLAPRYKVDAPRSVADAMNRPFEVAPAIVLIERSTLGPLDALLTFIRTLRERQPNVAIVVTGHKRFPSTEVVGCLEAGADDCIAIPFHPRELAARVDGIVGRRSMTERDSD